MLTALPEVDYDIRSYVIRPARGLRAVADGEVINLGDRTFEVLHLTGHSPGGIGLWEARTGTLFSGDAVYDGPLIDTLHHSNESDYARTMDSLPRLPVEVVHAGHDPSLGHERLLEIAESYLTRTTE